MMDVIVVPIFSTKSQENDQYLPPPSAHNQCAESAIAMHQNDKKHIVEIQC